MPQPFRLYVVAFLVFIVVDLVWLAFLAQPIYDHFIGDLLAEDPKWLGAILFYLLFIVGLVYFALAEAVREKSLAIATQKGAAYGFFTYMTYELTNYAVIEGWPIGIVPIDIAWGVVLATSVSTISYKIVMKGAKKDGSKA